MINTKTTGNTLDITMMTMMMMMKMMMPYILNLKSTNFCRIYFRDSAKNSDKNLMIYEENTQEFEKFKIIYMYIHIYI